MLNLKSTAKSKNFDKVNQNLILIGIILSLVFVAVFLLSKNLNSQFNDNYSIKLAPGFISSSSSSLNFSVDSKPSYSFSSFSSPSSSPSSVEYQSPSAFDSQYSLLNIKECDLAVKFKKSLQYQKPFFNLDSGENLSINCLNSSQGEFGKQIAEKESLSSQNELFYKLEKVSTIPFMKNFSDNIYLEKNQSGTGLGRKSDRYFYFLDDKIYTISLQKAMGNQPRNIEKTLTEFFDPDIMQIQFSLVS